MTDLINSLEALADGIGDCEVVADMMRREHFFHAADVIEVLPTIITALEAQEKSA